MDIVELIGDIYHPVGVQNWVLIFFPLNPLLNCCPFEEWDFLAFFYSCF
jgi:hypothetical protein